MELNSFQEITRTYHFKCTLCANCCTGDQKVHLNLFDLFKLAQHHNFKQTEKLFDSGLVHLIKTEQGVYLPRIRFKIKPFRFCPFLISEPKRGICTLHPDYKPLICTLAPAGRVVNFIDDTETWLFVKPAPDCPGVNSEQVNLLEDLKQKYQNELAYQKRFFGILNKLQASNRNRKYYLNEIYSFYTEQSFQTTLTEIERQLCR